MSSSDDQSLASLLTIDQRQELSRVIASATERMRDDISRGFQSKSISESATEASSDTKDTPQTDKEKTKATTDHAELSSTEFHKLQSAALAFFEDWRDRVLKRVNEVLSSESQSVKSKDHSHAQKVAETAKKDAHPASTSAEKAADAAIAKVYPPLDTDLVNLSYGERVTIINALLLILLSLESYTAHSRTLLLRMISSLNISVAELTQMEKDIAVGLLDAASHMDASSSTQSAKEANASSRKWKVGFASVAGAALVGITGGLAAPLLAAGVGGLMGGLGLGATAAAGYLGTLAGSGVLVGSLFGAYGGRMTGKMMDEYAKEVEDFAFLPLHTSQGGEGDRLSRLVEHFKPQKHEEDDAESSNQETAKENRRLRVTIGISGWLTDKSEVVSPWQVLGSGGEPFALRWELEALLNLGHAIQGAVKSFAWSYVKMELLKQTALAGLMAATWPLSFLKFSKVLDNPFSIAKNRADKAGAILADALINKVQGERPVSLIGYSLGARMIMTCLQTLAQRKAFGLVESVVVMGAPVPSDAQDWKISRSVVTGRLINVYSSRDYILGFLYRTSSVQYGVAGLQTIDESVHGVENVDVSDSVTGHLQYRRMVGQLLAEQVGWPDIDEPAVEKEKAAKEAEDKEDEQREKEAKQQQQQQQQQQQDIPEQGGGGEEDKASQKAEQDAQDLQQQLKSKMHLDKKT